MFSPEGRLYQVEYAMEAISKAGVVVGVLAKDGIVLVAEKKISSKVISMLSLRMSARIRGRFIRSDWWALSVSHAVPQQASPVRTAS